MRRRREKQESGVHGSRNDTCSGWLLWSISPTSIAPALQRSSLSLHVDNRRLVNGKNMRNISNKFQYWYQIIHNFSKMERNNLRLKELCFIFFFFQTTVWTQNEIKRRNCVYLELSSCFSHTNILIVIGRSAVYVLKQLTRWKCGIYFKMFIK